jgi:hypothetical protein
MKNPSGFFCFREKRLDEVTFSGTAEPEKQEGRNAESYCFWEESSFKNIEIVTESS